MGFKSLKEVDRLTIPEYNLLMKAVELKNVDLDYRLHKQAFLNLSVRAERKAGKGKTKLVYTKFSKFFDYKKELDKVMRKKKSDSRFAGIGKVLKKGGNHV